MRLTGVVHVVTDPEAVIDAVLNVPDPHFRGVALGSSRWSHRLPKNARPRCNSFRSTALGSPTGWKHHMYLVRAMA